MFDIESKNGRQEFSRWIEQQIDEWCVANLNDGHRNHLGASLIGHPCSRYLWLIFRWAMKQKFDAQTLRIFERGKREEDRFAIWLKAAGFEIQRYVPQVLHYHPESDSYFFKDEFEPNLSVEMQGASHALEDVTNNPFHEAAAEAQGIKRQQLRVIDETGHYGGSLDVEATHPMYPGIVFVVEEKTMNAKNYVNMAGSIQGGVRLNKPMHWVQMCTYGFARQRKFGIYTTVNKNDDKLYFEVAELDWELGAFHYRKAHSIIFSQTPPAKISEDPAFRECGYCKMFAVCHGGEPAEKSCRSCSYARPIQGGKWGCTHPQNNCEIPEHVIPEGCPHFISITGR